MKEDWEQKVCSYLLYFPHPTKLNAPYHHSHPCI